MTNYSYSTYIPEGDIYQGQFLLVRVLYAPTKLFFLRDTNLPIQGRTVSSEATSSTSTGVSKKVVLFQSYPQIPGEFLQPLFNYLSSFSILLRYFSSVLGVEARKASINLQANSRGV